MQDAQWDAVVAELERLRAIEKARGEEVIDSQEEFENHCAYIDMVETHIDAILSHLRQGQQDAKDAARYRWLHQFDGWNWSRPPMRAITFSWHIKCEKAELDSVIDAALSAEGSATK